MDYTIDLDRIVEDKFGKGHVPKFFVRALKRFFHLDYLNEFFAKGYEGVEFCNEAIRYLGVKVEVEGLENIPDDGTLYTFASNHPLGGIDGVALAGIIGEKFGTLTMLVNDFLMAIPGLRPLGIPVNKVGSQARNLPQLVAEAFGSDKQLLIFPAGLCSRRIEGKIQDLPWSKTFISRSISSGRSVVPVHFIGRNSGRFYRVARLCKILGLKFNFAMLLLPDEMYRGRGCTYKVKFGKPVEASEFDNSKTPAWWASWVREKVYSL